jgi:hypothetical protein
LSSLYLIGNYKGNKSSFHFIFKLIVFGETVNLPPCQLSKQSHNNNNIIMSKLSDSIKTAGTHYSWQTFSQNKRYKKVQRHTSEREKERASAETDDKSLPKHRALY